MRGLPANDIGIFVLQVGRRLQVLLQSAYGFLVQVCKRPYYHFPVDSIIEVAKILRLQSAACLVLQVSHITLPSRIIAVVPTKDNKTIRLCRSRLVRHSRAHCGVDCELQVKAAACKQEGLINDTNEGRTDLCGRSLNCASRTPT